MTKIFLNNKELKISQELVPVLISYPGSTGGSYFSISLFVALLKKGLSGIFFTAFPMATENLLKQTEGLKIRIGHINSAKGLVLNKNAQVLLVKPGDEELFLKVLEFVADVNNQVVFVKNFENLKPATLKKCLTLKKLVLSGELDKCELVGEVLKYKFKTTVLFAQSKLITDLVVPELKKYTGFMFGQDKSGVVRIKK